MIMAMKMIKILGRAKRVEMNKLNSTTKILGYMCDAREMDYFEALA